MKIKRNKQQMKNFIKAYKTIAKESNLALITFLNLIQVENDEHLLHLPYELSSYHPEKVLHMDLICYIAIKKLKQK